MSARAGALLVVGLALLPGCASLERDVAVYGTWAKRGQIMGDLAYVYCTQGAARERMVMRWSIDHSSPPAKVEIYCPVTDEDRAK